MPICRRGRDGTSNHRAFADADGAREWAIGWATAMLAIRRYAEVTAGR